MIPATAAMMSVFGANSTRHSRALRPGTGGSARSGAITAAGVCVDVTALTSGRGVKGVREGGRTPGSGLAHRESYSLTCSPPWTTASYFLLHLSLSLSSFSTSTGMTSTPLSGSSPVGTDGVSPLSASTCWPSSSSQS